MSADNGIYILKTAKYPLKEGNSYITQDGYEYRVAHCQNIDDIDYSDLYLVLLFSEYDIIDNENDAWNKAEQLFEEVGWIEHGISLIDMSYKYFPNMTKEAARKALDCYIGCEKLDV